LKHFRRLRTAAGIRRAGGPHAQPRLHDIRHTSATHRLIACYHHGKDVQRLLPYLSTYLGHASVESTQRYLTLTPELLQQASKRFHRYLEPEHRHG
jgi:integrase